MRLLMIHFNRDPPERTRLTMLQHLRVMEHSPAGHEVVYHNAVRPPPWQWGRDRYSTGLPDDVAGQRFDAVLLHYSFLSLRYHSSLDFARWKQEFEWIAALPAPKVALPQDEGDFVDLLDEWLFELEVTAIFSVHHRPGGPLYPIMRQHAAIHRCLPGYFDERDGSGRAIRPLSERPADLVYRARRLPLRYGKAGLEKHRIADVVGGRARELGFRTDVSTEAGDAVLGRAWLDFVASGRAVLGTPGGYSAVDRRGELRATVDALLREDPGLTLADLDAHLPAGWDDHRLFTVTPRHLEAVAVKTAQVLLAAEYQVGLRAGDHYLAVAPDYSNVDEVLDRLHDHRALQDMVDRAYEEVYVAGGYTYADFARAIDAALGELVEKEVPSVSNDSDALAVLERQLIAERNHNAMLQASMADLMEKSLERAIYLLVRRTVARYRWVLVAVAVLLVAAVVAAIVALVA